MTKSNEWRAVRVHIQSAGDAHIYSLKRSRIQHRGQKASAQAADLVAVRAAAASSSSFPTGAACWNWGVEVFDVMSFADLSCDHVACKAPQIQRVFRGWRVRLDPRALESIRASRHVLVDPSFGTRGAATFWRRRDMPTL